MQEVKGESRVFKDTAKTKMLQNNYISFTKTQPEDWALIKKYYGFDDSFPEDQLLCNEVGDRSVQLVNKEIRDILNFDSGREVNQVNLGIKAFEKSKTKTHTDVRFRMSQSAVEILYPFINKRNYDVNLEEILYLANVKNVKLDDVDAKYVNLRRIIDEGGCGFFVVRCKIAEDKYEYLCGQMMKHSIMFLADTECIEGLKLKYQTSFFLNIGRLFLTVVNRSRELACLDQYC